MSVHGWIRGLASAPVVLLLGACDREQDPVAAQMAIWRPTPRWDVRSSGGDGSVAWVLEGTLAALRDAAYQCTITGGPLKGGKVVEARHYYVGSGDTVTIVEILLLNGGLVTQSVKYADQAGRRRIVSENRDHPLLPGGSPRGLVGADTLATQLFVAAAAAPCPTPTESPRAGP